MKRRWLRLLGLAFLVESCLWLIGACRSSFDVAGNVDRTRPILIRSNRNLGMMLVQQGNDWVYFDEPHEVKRLEAVLKRTVMPTGARRTREGQLLDEHGSVLLDNIDESSVYAYSPKKDLLVWETPPGAHPYGLNIQYQGKRKFVRTWSIDGVQIRPDGTIWLAEYRFQCGIAVLNTDGQFQGWRAFGYQYRFVDMFGEVSDSDAPLVAELLARTREDAKKGF